MIRILRPLTITISIIWFSLAHCVIKLEQPQNVYHILLGHSVAISNDFAFVGAPDDDGISWDNGSVYIYKKSTTGTWLLSQKLTASDGIPHADFGTSISVSENILLVGAPYDGDYIGATGLKPGAAYIFEKEVNGDWVQRTKLVPTDTLPYYHFGYSVSIHGSTALIGAPASDSTYVFNRDESGNWLQRARLTQEKNPNSSSPIKFGHSVSVFENTALIGSPDEGDELGDRSGSAFVYVKNNQDNWTLEDKLEASDAEYNDSFGRSVSLSNNIALIGAPWNTIQGSNSGAAYIFKRTTNNKWNETTRLIPEDGKSGDHFGSSVVIDSNKALIGTPNAGSAYLFEEGLSDNWTMVEKLTDPGLEDLPETSLYDDDFGASVALSRGKTLIGASGSDSYVGAAYIFDLDPENKKPTKILKLILQILED